MKNLIYKIRDGHMTPSLKNETKNLKYKRKIHYDVYTEVWEFDKKEDWLEILKLTCYDQQEVVYTNIEDIDTYKIVNVDSYSTGLVNLLKNSEDSEKLIEFIEDEGWDLPIKLKAELALYGDYSDTIYTEKV